MKELMMAIAPLMEQGQFDLFENPWPKPQLRIVVGEVHEPASLPDRPAVIRTISAERQAPKVVRQRARVSLGRKRVMVGAVVLMAAIALATPLKALGGVTVTGQQTPGGLIPGEPYTVQTGDTIASIAARLGSPNSQVRLEQELRNEVGSGVVVPGEQISLP
jgi:LysM repeat protein